MCAAVQGYPARCEVGGRGRNGQEQQFHVGGGRAICFFGLVVQWFRFSQDGAAARATIELPGPALWAGGGYLAACSVLDASRLACHAFTVAAPGNRGAVAARWLFFLHLPQSSSRNVSRRNCPDHVPATDSCRVAGSAGI